MEFLFLKCSRKFMDTISHSETSLLGNFYMHEKNNVPFMIKNISFAFFPWPLLRSIRNFDQNYIVTKRCL